MSVLIFIFGLAIGSFLNVLIVRLPRSDISRYRNIVRGRSFCPKCKKTISWRDNIPLLSFLILKGRCRDCGLKISFQYPLVELLTAFLFLISFLIYGGNPVSLIYILFLISLFIVIAVIDLKYFLILDSLVLSGFLFFLFYWSLVIGHWSFYDSLYGLLFFAGIFLFLFLVTKGKGMGFGDVNLAAFLGFALGFKNAVIVFYLTFFIGLIVAIILLVFKKAGLKSKIPLGSIMAASAVLFLLLGSDFFDFAGFDLILRLWILQ